jgi:hypothetical protein
LKKNIFKELQHFCISVKDWITFYPCIKLQQIDLG